VIIAVFGTGALFLVGGCLGLGGMYYLKMNLIESKGKTNRQIMDEYSSGDKDSSNVKDYAPVDILSADSGTSIY
jgi:hypothetical protein